MCLVAIAWRAHPRYPLIVAGNRDEFHARASAPAGWWADAPVYGGRDLVAGGSWLAMSRGGRFAVVTNFPGRPAADPTAPSRGHLVRDFVAGDRPSGRFLDAVSVAETRYAGFCLVVGTRVQLRGFVSPRGAGRARWTLNPGVSVISNSPPAEPWPKALHIESAVARVLTGEAVAADGLFELLAQREPVGTEERGSLLSRTPFVVGDDYGTRATTVILVDAAGECRFIERRFGPGGRPAGESSETFHLA
jgi:uncharacterized protein with NRDE domain